MTELERKVLTAIRREKMLGEADRVVVGISGGADSVCLLFILKNLLTRASGTGAQDRLRAVHVHHGLRAAADADEDYVRKLCRALSIPLEVRHPDVAGYARSHGCGLEEAGHILRRQIFGEAADTWEREEPGCRVRIALAHHEEDQVETMLFHLARGTGLRGMTGMPPVSGRIIRPLLEVSREEIESYLREQNIDWRTDETNADAAYARNRIRLHILPELQAVNPDALGHCLRFAREAGETEAYLAVKTREALGRCCVSKSSGNPVAEEGQNGNTASRCTAALISISRLHQEERLIQKRVLYQILALAGGRRKDLSASHVEELLNLTWKSGSGRLSLPYGLTAWKVYDLLAVGRAEQQREILQFLHLCGEKRTQENAPEEGRKETGTYPLRKEDWHQHIFPYSGDPAGIPRNNCKKWFDYDKIHMPVAFRRRETGDYMTLSVGGQHKPLTRAMIDARIPADLRDRLILPFAGKEVLWLPGGRISGAFMIDGSTRTVLELAYGMNNME